MNRRDDSEAVPATQPNTAHGRSRRQWTEAEWDQHLAAIEPLRRTLHAAMGPIQNDAIRRTRNSRE